MPDPNPFAKSPERQAPEGTLCALAGVYPQLGVDEGSIARPGAPPIPRVDNVVMACLRDRCVFWSKEEEDCWFKLGAMALVNLNKSLGGGLGGLGGLFGRK